MGEVGEVPKEVGGGFAEGPGGYGGEGGGDGEEVQGVDEGPGEEASVFEDVGLPPAQEFDGEGEVEGPREADPEEGDGIIGPHRREEPRDKEPEEGGGDHVEGEEVGGEGHPDVVFADAHAAAGFADVQAAGASAEEHGPEGVGEFVAEDVGAGHRRHEAPDERPHGHPRDAREDGQGGQPPRGFGEDVEGAAGGERQRRAHGQQGDARREFGRAVRHRRPQAKSARARKSRVAKRSSRVSARRIGRRVPSGRRRISAERSLPL